MHAFSKRSTPLRSVDLRVKASDVEAGTWLAVLVHWAK
jgi:hypothetical protein